MKVHKMLELCERYGSNTTLGDLARKVQRNKIYKCPGCNGIGYIKVKCVAYFPDLHGGGWVQGWKYKDCECGLCNGDGYTEEKYKPQILYKTAGSKL